jgi:diaminopimelate decarboxylase
MSQAPKKTKRDPAPHAPLRGFENRNGVLHVGGRNCVDLASQHSAPVFIYDSAIISDTFKTLRAALPERVSIHYAVKANPFGPVVEHLAQLVDGLDVASQGELEMVRGRVGAAMPVSFAGPAKRDAELAAAIDLGCTVNVESEGELMRLAALAAQKSVQAKAAVRVNPPFDLRGSGMRMGGGAKPFGIDDDAVPALLAKWPSADVAFEGFHIFTGSQSLAVDALCDAHEAALALALELSQHAPCPPSSINIGGGIGVPYFPGDRAVDVQSVGKSLAGALKAQESALGNTKVIMELGRYLVAEAGVYLAEIVDKKTSRGVVFLMTDGGLHHQLAVSGNFGQVFRKNYPVAIANKVGKVDGAQEWVNVVGCLCTPLDRLADDVLLPRAQIGDYVAVFRCGAYGPTASPSAFLNHPKAAEIMV